MGSILQPPTSLKGQKRRWSRHDTGHLDLGLPSPRRRLQSPASPSGWTQRCLLSPARKRENGPVACVTVAAARPAPLRAGRPGSCPFQPSGDETVANSASSLLAA